MRFIRRHKVKEISVRRFLDVALSMNDPQVCLHCCPALWIQLLSTNAQLYCIWCTQIFYTVYTFFDDLKLTPSKAGANNKAKAGSSTQSISVNPHTAPYAQYFNSLFADGAPTGKYNV